MARHCGMCHPLLLCYRCSLSHHAAEHAVLRCAAVEREAIQAELDALAAEQPEAVKEPAVAPLLGGAAAHHAGCLPAWKSLIERLFQRGEAAQLLTAVAIVSCCSVWAVLPASLGSHSSSASSSRVRAQGFYRWAEGCLLLLLV